MRRVLGVACLLGLAVLTCTCENDADSTASLVRQAGRADAREAVALANAWRTEHPDIRSTLTALSVDFVFRNGETVSVPLPAETMVLSVAPYRSATHPCEIHSFSGCSGEMVRADVRVLARTADGTLLIDQTVTTMDNGFVDLWLPRNIRIHLTLESGGEQTAGWVSTYISSATCLTGFRLAS